MMGSQGLTLEECLAISLSTCFWLLLLVQMKFQYSSKGEMDKNWPDIIQQYIAAILLKHLGKSWRIQ